MTSNEFLLTATLKGHTATITAVEFSPDGRFLASAGDDGAILIFSTSSWSPVCCFLDVSPASVLLWHEKKRYLLVSGHQSGDVHYFTISKLMVGAVRLIYQNSTHNRQTEMYSYPNFNVRWVHPFLVPLTDIFPNQHCLWE